VTVRKYTDVLGERETRGTMIATTATTQTADRDDVATAPLGLGARVQEPRGARRPSSLLASRPFRALRALDDPEPVGGEHSET